MTTTIAYAYKFEEGAKTGTINPETGELVVTPAGNVYSRASLFGDWKYREYDLAVFKTLDFPNIEKMSEYRADEPVGQVIVSVGGRTISFFRGGYPAPEDCY